MRGMIMGGMHHGPDMVRMSSELIGTLILVAICILIYYKTKDLYNLTKHKGIGYFRKTFLFFGIAFFTRFIFMGALLFLDHDTMKIIPREIFPISLMITAYISFVAVIYLFMSSAWKSFPQFKSKTIESYIHLIAIICSLIVFISKSPLLFIIIHIWLLALTVVLSLIKLYQKHKLQKRVKEKTSKKIKKKKSKFGNTHTIYFLILLFWIVNLHPMAMPRFMPIEIRIALQIIPVIIFGIIYNKVSKWTR